MMKLEPGVSNPWDSKSLEDFLHFLCPECNYITKYSDDFLDHCQNHPMANDFIMSNQDIMDDGTNVEPTEFVDCSVMEAETDEIEQPMVHHSMVHQSMILKPLPLPPHLKLPKGKITFLQKLNFSGR